MCGIVGILAFNKAGLYKIDVELFLELMKVATVRGTDGAGLIYVGDEESGLAEKDNPPIALWVKQGSNALNFMEGELFQKHLNDGDFDKSRFLIGHCRAATKGDITTDNAHPFEEGPIIMVHNGTIDINMKPDAKDFQVDSHALCYQLAQKPAVEVLRNLNGPTAVVWYDKRDWKLRIYRNYERTLFAKTLYDKMVIASEPWMIAGILGRHSFPREDIKTFEAGKIYEYTHDNINATIIDVPAKTGVSWGGHRRYGRGQDEYWDAADAKWKAIPQRSLLDHPPVALPKPRVVNLPYRKKNTEADLTALHAATEKYLASVKQEDGIDLIPMKDYFSIELGHRVVFEPTNMEFLDEGEKRALFTGVFREALPLQGRPYGMLEDVTVLAKTHKKPKPGQLPKQLYQKKALVGKVDSITMSKDDMTDVRINLIDVEPFEEQWLAEWKAKRTFAAAC